MLEPIDDILGTCRHRSGCTLPFASTSIAKCPAGRFRHVRQPYGKLLYNDYASRSALSTSAVGRRRNLFESPMWLTARNLWLSPPRVTSLNGMIHWNLLRCSLKRRLRTLAVYTADTLKHILKERQRVGDDYEAHPAVG
jgi:hypothetical protein